MGSAVKVAFAQGGSAHRGPDGILVGRARRHHALPLAGLNRSRPGSSSFVENARIGTHYRDINDQHIATASGCPLFRLPTTAQRFSMG